MPFRFAELDRRAVEDPHSLIHDFISQLEQLLVNLVHDTVEGFDFKPDFGEDIGLMRLGLEDAQASQLFARAHESIAAANLEDTRLAGNGLRSKFGVLSSLSDQMRRGLRKALTYILDMVNAVLGSIEKAVGGVTSLVIDAIRELKDMVKAKIDLINGW